MPLPPHPTPRSPLWRLSRSCWRQRAHLLPAPADRLEGRRVLVTGGNGGIGLETARGLLERGARVILACRSPERAARAADRLRRETGVHPDAIDTLACDLADLRQVAGAAQEALRRFGRLDGLAANAGIWPQGWAETAQGIEVAHGVNVLGHTLLIQSLLEGGGLMAGSRVVILTGDIYILVSDAEAPTRYGGRVGGMLAYCRSKLGNLWMRAAFAARHPEIGWYAVHPGVVASDLAGAPAWMRPGLEVGMLTTAEGARTSLRCLSAPDLRPGYYHSALGEVTFSPGDPGGDVERADRYLASLLARLAPFRAPAGAAAERGPRAP